jgi:predicted ATP-dependent endonuclease of OLD family
MFIKKISIDNFRLFDSGCQFEIDDFNIPDGENDGAGINIFVGENGSGKTSLLDALALPMLSFKSENFDICDLNNPKDKAKINIFSDGDFKVSGTMPNSAFQAKGFQFTAGFRARNNKAYLSSTVVTDQIFIKVDPEKPKEGSPDLRVSVNNPFGSKRFNENEVVVIDRNRLYQTRTGNFNTTRFDRLMEDYNYQYLKSLEGDLPNLNDELGKNIKSGKLINDKIENKLLEKIIMKFEEMSGSRIHLNFIDNYKPFDRAFFGEKKVTNQQLELSSLGSGYEMAFSLLYSFYMSQQSNKQLIMLIDEPELHMHPRLQSKFVNFLIEMSKTVQIFLTTHSPLLIKQLAANDYTKILILREGKEISEPAERKLTYISANETNYIAFNLATEEYHNELFEELKHQYGDDKSIKDFDRDFFVEIKDEIKNSPWRGNKNEVSIHTFIRNQIHHQKENGKTEYSVLEKSIETMRSYF